MRGVPDPRRAVVAAAGEQLPVRAEGERADPALGQAPDQAAGARTVRSPRLVDFPAGSRRRRPVPSGRERRSRRHAAGSAIVFIRPVARSTRRTWVPLPTSSVVRSNESAVTGDGVEIVRTGVGMRGLPDRDAPAEGTGRKEAGRPGSRRPSVSRRCRWSGPEQPPAAVVEPDPSVAARHERGARRTARTREDDVPAEPDDRALTHRGEARAEDVGGLAARGELARPAARG